MDPLRIIVRVVFAYVLLLTMIRLSGKRTVRHASPFDFTVALIVGDLTDDLLWAEVGGAMFTIAAGTLMFVYTAFDMVRYRVGLWR